MTEYPQDYSKVKSAIAEADKNNKLDKLYEQCCEKINAGEGTPFLHWLRDCIEAYYMEEITNENG